MQENNLPNWLEIMEPESPVLFQGFRLLAMANEVVS